MDRISHITDFIPSLLGILPLFVAGLLVMLLRLYAPWFARKISGLTTVTAAMIALIAVAWMATTFAFLEFRVHPFGGSDAYAARAMNIIERGVFGIGKVPMALFPPGYTFLLVPAFYVFGDSRWPIFLTNAALLVGTSVFLRHILLKLNIPKGYSNALALGMILYPNRLLSVLIPFSDIPFSLIYMCAFALMILSNEHPRKLWYTFFIGVAAAGASLIRANGIPLFLALLAGVWMETGNARPQRQLRIGVLLGGFLLVILPWGIRNFSIYGTLIPVSNNFGLNLAIGNNSSGKVTHNSYIDSAWTPDAWRSIGAETWNEAQKDRFLANIGFTYIREHPGKFLENGPRKIRQTIAADASTFGLLETYTNMRSIVLSHSRDSVSAPAAQQKLYVLYTGGYLVLYVVNNTLYYASAILVFMLLWKNRKSLSSYELSFVLVLLISLALVFVLFGTSRFKEPIPTTLLLVLGLGLLRGRGPISLDSCDTMY